MTKILHKSIGKTWNILDMKRNKRLMDKFVGIVKNHCTFVVFLVDCNICNHNFVENVFVKTKKKSLIFSEDPVKLVPVNCS